MFYGSRVDYVCACLNKSELQIRQGYFELTNQIVRSGVTISLVYYTAHVFFFTFLDNFFFFGGLRDFIT